VPLHPCEQLVVDVAARVRDRVGVFERDLLRVTEERALRIGAAFHAAGGRVALGDVNTSGLGRAAERLGASDRVFTHAVDVRDAASVEKFVAASESALGPVTIAVANAGIYPNCPVLEMTQEPAKCFPWTAAPGPAAPTCRTAARRSEPAAPTSTRRASLDRG
jgi:NAD(P)-dependent dehydrogenase (short-subunit alcohol dehydrogenase family)